MIKQKKGKTPGAPPTMTVEKEPGVFKVIKDSPYTRILGANLQCNMLWTAHLESGVKAIFPQLRKQIGRLRHLGNLIPMECRNNLAKGLIHSRMNYIMPLWGGATESHLKKAQVILNIAARWATGLGRRTRITKLMKTAGWLTVKEQIRVATLVYTWKSVHLGKPPRPLERMTITPDKKIIVQEPRLMFSKDCYRWRGSSMWNDLPQELRELKSISSFKRQLRRLVEE